MRLGLSCQNLHLGSLHRLDQVQLALGNLDDLFDQARANLLLQLVDPVPGCQFTSFALP